MIHLQHGEIYRCQNGHVITVEEFTTPTGRKMFRPWNMDLHFKGLCPLPKRPYEGYTFTQYGLCNEDADFDIKEEVIPNVDLTKCKEGERLVTRHGWIVTYVGKSESREYPHLIIHPNGSEGTRCNDGYVYKNKRTNDDIDIVEVLEGIPMKMPEPEII